MKNHTELFVRGASSFVCVLSSAVSSRAVPLREKQSVSHCVPFTTAKTSKQRCCTQLPLVAWLSPAAPSQPPPGSLSHTTAVCVSPPPGQGPAAAMCAAPQRPSQQCQCPRQSQCGRATRRSQPHQLQRRRTPAQQLRRKRRAISGPSSGTQWLWRRPWTLLCRTRCGKGTPLQQSRTLS